MEELHLVVHPLAAEHLDRRVSRIGLLRDRKILLLHLPHPCLDLRGERVVDRGVGAAHEAVISVAQEELDVDLRLIPQDVPHRLDEHHLRGPAVRLVAGVVLHREESKDAVLLHPLGEFLHLAVENDERDLFRVALLVLFCECLTGILFSSLLKIQSTVSVLLWFKALCKALPGTRAGPRSPGVLCENNLPCKG